MIAMLYPGIAFIQLYGRNSLFVDTCHSGKEMGAKRGWADINAVANELSNAENGAVVFCLFDWKAVFAGECGVGNGAFTKALVESVGGKADYKGEGTDHHKHARPLHLRAGKRN